MDKGPSPGNVGYQVHEYNMAHHQVVLFDVTPSNETNITSNVVIAAWSETDEIYGLLLTVKNVLLYTSLGTLLHTQTVVTDLIYHQKSSFWFSWADGLVQVGKGLHIGQHQIMAYRDSQSDRWRMITHLRIRSYGTKTKFEVYKSMF